MRNGYRSIGWIAVAIFCAGMGDEMGYAQVVPGGGPARTDCLAVLDTPLVDFQRGRRIVCTDGDVACDADATVNGSCSFSLGVCANATGLSNCTSTGVAWIEVAHAEDDGDRLFDPDFQALQSQIDSAFDFPEMTFDTCTNSSVIHVAVDGPRRGGRCRAGRKKLELDTRSVFNQGRVVRDRDRLYLVCRPAREGCSARLFFDGTFDRIQTQIFDRRCATGGCHDSESTAGGLLLERGASYTSLVGVVPSNGAAAAAGLLLVDGSPSGAGDLTKSFLLRKLQGDLGPGTGGRMPLGEARIPAHLVGVVADWISAEAPQTGWVAGTD